MNRKLLLILCAFCSIGMAAKQLPIPRIEQMPNFPQPYQMKDWRQVTIDYDRFVFDTESPGKYLPLSRLSSDDGLNYPEVGHFYMDTYVGHHSHLNMSEAINVMPAVVGASLIGIDKSNQSGENWVRRMKNFFNLKNGQQVYLNGFSAGTGHDWWYEVMPNLFFVQLYSLYPQLDPDFQVQLRMLADRQLEVISGLGGKDAPWTAPYMNYRAYNLMTGKPNNTSVPEPESAGSIAWILYQSYLMTGEAKYLKGAELAMDFLQGWEKNPSYEIQLPYGIAAAARLNAVEGTNYDLQKMLEWTFSSGRGTLRGWGTIVGKWGGYDVSGLIGEANDNGDDYAFSMNGFQHAAALAPVAKYDKRYARAIAKWLLNVANASRLFYPDVLPTSSQEPASASWSKSYDSKASIPFESLKQKWNGKSPFAMGDAVRGGWASTDLSLYSGSSVGYLASLLRPTNIEGILQIDLNVTDFNGENKYPNYLYYNPTTSTQTVELEVGSTSVNVYDAISETILQSGVTGKTTFTIAPDTPRLLVLYPSGSSIQTSGRIRRVYGGGVIDYHYRYDYTNVLRIKSVAADQKTVPGGSPIRFYGVIENGGSGQVIEWYVNGVKVPSANTLNWVWTTPSESGLYRVKMKVSYDYKSVESEEILITLAPEGMQAPVIHSLTVGDQRVYSAGSRLSVESSADLYESQIEWSVSGGALLSEESLTPQWQLPDLPGLYEIKLRLTNMIASTERSIRILVKRTEESGAGMMPLIYYSFNGNSQNQVSDRFSAVGVEVVQTADARGEQGMAYQLPTSSSFFYTNHAEELNFREAVALSFWVKADQLPNSEQFILSHGSWEERYKVSITPEKKLRWTLKTTDGIADVDDSQAMTLGEFRHYTVQYTGHSLELYRNGSLIDYKPLSGAIGTTTKALTLGRKEQTETNYTFRGTIDEVRLYDQSLPLRLIAELPQIWDMPSGILSKESTPVSVFPNPFNDMFYLKGSESEELVNLQIIDVSGAIVWQRKRVNSSGPIFQVHLSSGVYLLKISTSVGSSQSLKLIKY